MWNQVQSGVRRSTGEGHGNPLQCRTQRIHMDRKSLVYSPWEITKSWTHGWWLTWLSGRQRNGSESLDYDSHIYTTSHVFCLEFRTHISNHLPSNLFLHSLLHPQPPLSQQMNNFIFPVVQPETLASSLTFLSPFYISLLNLGTLPSKHIQNLSAFSVSYRLSPSSWRDNLRSLLTDFLLPNRPI